MHADVFNPYYRETKLPQSDPQTSGNLCRSKRVVILKMIKRDYFFLD